MNLYLSSSAIGFLALLIFSIIITGYLFLLCKDSEDVAERKETFLLGYAFLFLSIFLFLLLIKESALFSWHIYAQYLESPTISLMLVAILQFAYHFTQSTILNKRAPQIALMFSGMYVFWELALVSQRFQILITEGHISSRPQVADYPLAIIFGWIVFVFLLGTIRESKKISEASTLQHILNPQGKKAEAFRSFALAFLFPIFLFLFDIIATNTNLLSSYSQIVMFLGLLIALFLFASIYINYFPEKNKIIIRITGIMLIVNLAVIGITAWVHLPLNYEGSKFESFFSISRALHYSPNTVGGFDVSIIPFQFQENLGTKITDNYQSVNLPFEFPFYGQNEKQVLVGNNGVISFDNGLSIPSFQNDYGPSPKIFTFYTPTSSVFSSDTLTTSEGIYYNPRPQNTIITWHQIKDVGEQDNYYSIQLILYINGEFDILFQESQSDISPLLNWQEYIIGPTPGNATAIIEHIKFETDLPYSGQANGAVISNQNIAFRELLHKSNIPFVYLLIFSTFFIILVFPIVFKKNLITPLEALLSAAQQIKNQDGNGKITVEHLDEIGVISQIFNEIVSLASTDPMTGIFNRRSFFNQARSMLSESEQRGFPFSVLLLDIDYFKSFNDEHGHAVGDEVVNSFVKHCNKNLRNRDLFGRIGGDEFAIVLFNTDREGAYKIAQRMIHLKFNANTVSNQPLEVTASIGVATHISGNISFDSLLKRADEALYEAKRKGRNQAYFDQNLDT